MARITLNAKLKKRPDYTEIVAKIKNATKPVKYVQDTFSVTYLTAKKLVDELNTGIVISSKKEEDVSVVDKRADIFIKKMYISFNPNSSPSSYTFSKIGEELEDLDLPTLNKIFFLLHEKETKTNYKFLVVKALKYIIQQKYYDLVFHKAIPEYVNKYAQDCVQECLSA